MVVSNLSDLIYLLCFCYASAFILKECAVTFYMHKYIYFHFVFEIFEKFVLLCILGLSILLVFDDYC